MKLQGVHKVSKTGQTLPPWTLRVTFFFHYLMFDQQGFINGKILNLYNLTITFIYGDTFNKFPSISSIATQKHIITVLLIMRGFLNSPLSSDCLTEGKGEQHSAGKA